MISRKTTLRNSRSKTCASELLMLAVLLLCCVNATAQDSKLLKQQEKAAENSLDLTFQGNSDLTQNQDDIQAEMAYTIVGVDSTEPNSATSSAKRCSRRTPASGRDCSRPRKRIIALTLSPAWRNSAACLRLVS